MAKKPRLCEIIAVVSGKKTEVEKAVTDAYHRLQKPELFGGFSKTYRPLAEDGKRLPPESKQVQLRLDDVVAESCARWRELFDLTLTLDRANCGASADVEVDGTVLLTGVPVTTLLFLEKQAENLHAYVSKLPTPDAAERWHYDESQHMLVTDPEETGRTEKVQKPIVLYDATKEHPAQTQLITEDVLAGYWSKRMFTTAIPAKTKAEILARVGKLRDAVKAARERANAVEVEKQSMGDALLGYVFGTLHRGR